MSTSPIPIELRLRALEARILGVPRSQLAGLNPDGSDNDTAARPSSAALAAALTDPSGERAPTLARRLAALEDRMDSVGATSPALRQFCDNYAHYAPLLALPTDLGEKKDGGDKDKAAKGSDDAVHARDLVPTATQVAMVLEARADIVDAELGLREIDVLEKRGVAGGEGLEDIVALKPALAAGREHIATQSKNLAETRGQVAGLVERYTEFTTTVSDMFVALHEQLAAMEEVVARAERAKRAEVAGRF